MYNDFHKHQILYIVTHDVSGTIYKSKSYDSAKRVLHDHIISLFNAELNDEFLSCDCELTKQDFLKSEHGAKLAQKIWDDARSFYKLYERTILSFSDEELDIEDVLLESSLTENYHAFIQ